ncbi:DUF262 domain-containing protein [Falsiroseomonas sp. E2-1-a20]|uniref:DUF262 domain-containing protein n=1 Tax=Falsiroseomonas sp. E2-1-a20 TaxID=3239300 RepID=UPI003F3D820D
MLATRGLGRMDTVYAIMLLNSESDEDPMKPRYISLAQVFGPPVRFVVPLFQRAYVWEQKAQWEPLWKDISTVAERLLTTPAGAPVRGHFLGSVVLEQESTGTGNVERRLVIDGQQRLTTLQILLKAAEHAFASASTSVGDDSDVLTKAGQQVASLVANPAYAEGEEAYKVWPTNKDRGYFRAVMDATAPANVAGAGNMVHAHAFFFEAISAWLKQNNAVGTRTAALSRALMHHLHVIVLDLEATDEPQAIFETLNTGGAPLSPVDLVKNWLLWEAARDGHDETACARLHAEHWQPFDVEEDYWRQRVGTGHAARPRVDGFLVNWLITRLRKPVAVGHVYEAFLDHVALPARGQNGIADAPALMREIQLAAEQYRKLDAPKAGGGRFGTFLHRLKAMNVVVLHPLLMHLLSRPGSNVGDLNECAAVLESFLVRRLVCASGTRGYGTLFVNLLDEVAKKGVEGPAAPVVTHFLAAGQSATSIWPDDVAFARHWALRDAYKGSGARPFMILRALEEEEWRRDHLAMPVAHFDWSRVQVEHVMPQAWRGNNWQLPHDGDGAARDEAVHRIGNLTLVSEALNPILSNGPWMTKREALKKHIHLRLTGALVSATVWDEAAIDARSSEFFELAKSIWPAPPSLHDKASRAVGSGESSQSDPDSPLEGSVLDGPIV